MQNVVAPLLRPTGRATPPLLRTNVEALASALARRFLERSTGDPSVKELSATSTLLRNLRNGSEVYVVGTAHVSSRSAAEVRDTIQLVKPTSVVLELCEHRLRKLRSNGHASPGFLKTLLSQLGMPGSLQGKLFGAGLSGMYGMLKTIGLEPGAEFKAAIEEADAMGAAIICGDQDQHITAQKISEHLVLMDLVKMMSSPPDVMPKLEQTFKIFSGGLEETVEALKTRESARQMSDFMRTLNPRVANALIDERDEILASALLQLKGRAVAVVGLAHLDGIERIWRARAC